jgi:lipoprotein NlpD
MIGFQRLNGPRTAWRLSLLLLLCATLAGFSGCTNIVHAPVTDRNVRPAWTPGTHRVRPGETLYSIAFQYNLRYEQVAQWNGIRSPYTIHVGQVLKLRPATSSRIARPAPPARTSTSVSTDTLNKPSPTSVPQPRPAATTQAWQWPAQGRILRTFQANSPGKKGIEIGGTRGQPVRAAAPGRVVYAGSGLVGYGGLIIIKHDERFLSAYGYNDKLFVQEGSQVHVGQVIAEMGSSGTNRVQLHFEIRKDGKPVDPLQYLPRR